MPVEEDKALESTEPPVDPPARRTCSKAAAAASDTSFTPMVATRPAIPKPTPSSSRKGKEVVRDSSPVSAFLIRKQRRSTPLSSTPSKRPRHAFDGKNCSGLSTERSGEMLPTCGRTEDVLPILEVKSMVRLAEVALVV
jgi:hypothetical protein